MQIYVMRHGQAELMAPSDSKRALSTEGRLEAEKMAAYLADNHVCCDAVLVSPYLRAQQTLDSVQSYIAQHAKVEVLKCLTPAGNVSKLTNEIIALQASGIKSLLIISHLPLVGYIVGELAPAAGTPAFATSSVAHLELDDNGFGVLHHLTSVAQIIAETSGFSAKSCNY